MNNIRIISRLDIKGSNLIKGIHLEGLRIIGEPNSYARDYYFQGADEIIYMDCVASLYGRNNLSDIVKTTLKNVFIPITVGGGIRTVSDAQEMLKSGADKIAINTGAVKNPKIISEMAQSFGSQCMVSSIDAKKVGDSKWEVYTDSGRERTGLDVVEWAEECESLGAGEILLTSIDREGTRKGFDVELIRAVSNSVDIPIIASGGMGVPKDLLKAVAVGADAVAIADILHYKKYKVDDVRLVAKNSGLAIREFVIDDNV